MKKIAVGLLVVGSWLAAGAVDGVWTGAGSDGLWTNADNWQGGVIPGRISAGGTVTGSGGDTATFGAVAAGAQTTVDLTGVASIGGITVVGADAPAYQFGTSDVWKQCLNFESDGTGFRLGEGVRHSPTVPRGYKLVYVTNAYPNLTICNASTNCVFDLPAKYDLEKDADFASDVTAVTLDFRGAGDVRIGKLANNAGFRNHNWLLNQTGKLIVGVSMVDLYGQYPPFRIVSGSVPAVSRMEIEEGVYFKSANAWHPQLTVWQSDLAISGKGKIGFNWRAAYDGGSLCVRIQNGRKLTMTCGYEAFSDQSATSAAPGVRAHRGNADATDYPGSNFYGGDWQFFGETTVAGPVQNFFGNMETDHAGGFGTGEIQLSCDSVLRYSGAADWTMNQNTVITNWPSRTDLKGVLEAAGAGVWTLAGNLTLRTTYASAGGTYTLRGAGTGVIAGVLANQSAAQPINLVKSGTGTWTLAGANTFTGATTINAGTLAVAKTGTLATSSGVTLKGGVLKFAGDADATTEQTLAKLSLAGDATLELTDRVTVTVAAFARSSGTLNIVTAAAGAKLIVPAGTSAVAFTWNGRPAVIGADGEVKTDADAVISARGDVVPNNGGKVGIFYAGTTGDDTLAADTTALTALTQASSVPATIAFGAGQTLIAPQINLLAGAADLTLGTADGTGTLAADAAHALTFNNQDDAAAIRVRAKIDAAVKTNEVARGAVVLQGEQTLARTQIASADQATARLDVRGGTVEPGYDPILVGNNLGTDYAGGGVQFGELTVSNALVRNAADLARADHTYANGHEYALVVGKNASGTLRVEEGAVISNKLQIGAGLGTTAGRGSGAVYQNGGTVVTIGDDGYLANALGNMGMGYYELNAGTFEGNLMLGGYGYGIWHQEPGTTANLGRVATANGNGGHADVYVRGTLKASAKSSQLCGGYQNGGISVFTVEGPGCFDCGNQSVYAFISTAVCTSRVNVVRGGKIHAAATYRHSNAPAAARYTIAFDGGIWQGVYNMTDVFAQDGKNAVDEVRVYSGGITIDTDGHDLGTAQVLKTAEGSGVAAIPFDYAAFSKWNAAPYVDIAGDGQGATAHALFDSSRQMVTGVVITCSGSGYTWAKATATYKGNGCPANVMVDCDLAENAAAGAFTKVGTGTFTLNATNGWSGTVIAQGGTFKVGCDYALSNRTVLVLAGGTVEFNGKAGQVTSLTYRVGGGKILKKENVAMPSGFDVLLTAEEVLDQQAVAFEGDVALTGNRLVLTGDLSGLDAARKYTLLTTANGKFSGAPTLEAAGLSNVWDLVVRGANVFLRRHRGTTVIVR